MTTRALATALALIATGRLYRLRPLFAAALQGGVALEALREGMLMAPLFAGFPRALEAFAALEDVAGPLPHAAREQPDMRLAKRGAWLFRQIYGRQAEAVRKRLAQFHPDLERAVLEDAYGRILARPALAARTRELMAVCALAASQLTTQLRSHLRGAIRCGASGADLREMIDIAGWIAGEAAAAVGRQELNLVLSGPRTGADEARAEPRAADAP